MNLGNIRQKFDAFGWKTLETNGNNMDEIVATLKEAKSLTGKGQPVAILMHTIMVREWILWRMIIAGMGPAPATNS